jgi:hypothetical protein
VIKQSAYFFYGIVFLFGLKSWSQSLNETLMIISQTVDTEFNQLISSVEDVLPDIENHLIDEHNSKPKLSLNKVLAISMLPSPEVSKKNEMIVVARNESEEAELKEVLLKSFDNTTTSDLQKNIFDVLPIGSIQESFLFIRYPWKNRFIVVLVEPDYFQSVKKSQNILFQDLWLINSRHQIVSHIKEEWFGQKLSDFEKVTAQKPGSKTSGQWEGELRGQQVDLYFYSIPKTNLKLIGTQFLSPTWFNKKSSLRVGIILIILGALTALRVFSSLKRNRNYEELAHKEERHFNFVLKNKNKYAPLFYAKSAYDRITSSDWWLTAQQFLNDKGLSMRDREIEEEGESKTSLHAHPSSSDVTSTSSSLSRTPSLFSSSKTAASSGESKDSSILRDYSAGRSQSKRSRAKTAKFEELMALLSKAPLDMKEVEKYCKGTHFYPHFKFIENQVRQGLFLKTVIPWVHWSQELPKYPKTWMNFSDLLDALTNIPHMTLDKVHNLTEEGDIEMRLAHHGVMNCLLALISYLKLKSSEEFDIVKLNIMQSGDKISFNIFFLATLDSADFRWLNWILEETLSSQIVTGSPQELHGYLKFPVESRKLNTISVRDSFDVKFRDIMEKANQALLTNEDLNSFDLPQIIDPEKILSEESLASVLKVLDQTPKVFEEDSDLTYIETSLRSDLTYGETSSRSNVASVKVSSKSNMTSVETLSRSDFSVALDSSMDMDLDLKNRKSPPKVFSMETKIRKPRRSSNVTES